MPRNIIDNIIAIGADHAGFALKTALIAELAGLGCQALDVGTADEESVDYPDYAKQVVAALKDGRAARGVLVCGSGIGMSIAANKVKGIRAALCHDELTAELSRRHNDANVLCLPADLIGEHLINRVIDVWLQTEYEGGRHQRRIDKITAFEQNGHAASPDTPS